MSNQDAVYAAQDREVNEMFQDEAVDWHLSVAVVDQALSSAELPSWYRAQYHAIRYVEEELS